MTFESPSLEFLMRQAQGGDQRAYSLLLKETAGILRSYLRRWLKSSSEIDDIIQEILISVHKSRHTYDGLRPYKPWLYAIAKFRLSEYWRRVYADRLRTAADLTEVEKISDPHVTNSGDTYEYLHEGLKSLSDKQSEIVRLIHIDGLTSKEVAKKLTMKENAVKVAAHRAYKTLRRKFEEE
jgi:RNA polymerase sigma-70 factor (ECF subfamily)